MNSHELERYARIQETIKQFANLIHSGIESWIKAGKLLVEMKDENPDIFSIITEEHPSISWATLKIFEGFGLRKIYPYLMLDNSEASKRALQFAYEDQVRVYKNPIEIVIGIKEDGTPEIVKRKLQKLSMFDVERAFAFNRVLTVKEQVAQFAEKRNARLAALEVRKAHRELKNRALRERSMVSLSSEVEDILDHGEVNDWARVEILLCLTALKCPCGAKINKKVQRLHTKSCNISKALEIIKKHTCVEGNTSFQDDMVRLGVDFRDGVEVFHSKDASDA